MTSYNKKTEERGVLASVGNVAMLFAASLGIPVDRITEETGITPAELMDPDARIPNESLLKLWLILAEAESEQNISLKLAKIAPFALLGSPGRLFNMAPDLRTAMELFVENHDLISDLLEAEQIDTAEEMLLRINHPLDDFDGGIGAEITIGIAVRILNEKFGNNSLVRVQFKHKARSDLAIYEAYFSVPIVFNAPFNAVIIHSKALDLPNKQTNLRSSVLLRQNFRLLRRELGADKPDSLEKVREVIVCQVNKGDYTVNGLAKGMAMSMRSLQRLIRSSGTSARVMIDEARYNNAMELLADKNLSIEEIAYKLDFDSDRSFRRAFTRWAGKSPAQARREF